MRPYNRTVRLKVVLQEGEDGQVVVHVPALPGCWSQGVTRQDAFANIKEAAELWLEVQQDRPDTATGKSEVELINI